MISDNLKKLQLPKAVILIEANDRPDKTFEKKSEDVYWGL
jgi:hypothetical protein